LITTFPNRKHVILPHPTIFAPVHPDMRAKSRSYECRQVDFYPCQEAGYEATAHANIVLDFQRCSLEQQVLTAIMQVCSWPRVALFELIIDVLCLLEFGMCTSSVF